MLTSVATMVTMQHYYDTIDYIPYAVSFLSVTHSFRNWKPLSLIPPQLLCSSPHPPSLAAISFYIYRSDYTLSFSIHLFLRFHIEVKWYDVRFSLSNFFHLALYPLAPSVLSQIAKMAKISYFSLFLFSFF